jgi:chitinase
MLLKNRYLAVFAVAVAGAAAALVPITASEAAVACAPAWSATAVYTNGMAASQNSHNYTAKWWTQNESPATHSGQWDVWADNGVCGGSTPTTPPPTGPTTPPPSGGTKMPSSPYIYPGWGNPPAPSTVMSATGIRAFTIAFVLANGCNPVWDGEGGLTGGVHASTINAIKAAGGSVVPSVGGWQGNKLGPNCSTPEALAGAYQKVIDAFGLQAIDIDIENYDEFENTVVQDRILNALKIVKLVCVTSRGGDYSTGTPMQGYDMQEPYLRAIFGFVGITDIEFVNLQPMDMDQDAREDAIRAGIDTARHLADRLALARLG